MKKNKRGRGSSHASPHPSYWLVVLLVLLLCVGLAYAQPEKYYQEKWCAEQGGKAVTLSDGTECDCVTTTHAVEVDFAKKWYEALGQSLHYSRMTGKRAGILLIVGPDDVRFVDRLQAVIATFCIPVDVWTIKK